MKTRDRVLGVLRFGPHVEQSTSPSNVKAAWTTSVVALPDNVRAISRISRELLLRSVASTSQMLGDELTKSVVYTAIWTANVRHITRSSMNAVYGSMNLLPPDSERVPVSVHALAASLRLPYETTRRAAAKLIDEKLCLRVAGRGLIIPLSALESPVVYEQIRHGRTAIIKFLGDLRRAGFDFKSIVPKSVPLQRLVAAENAPDNVRAVLRIHVDYIMRSLDALSLAHGNNLMAGLIFSHILVANTAASEDHQTEGGRDLARAPSDEGRQPVSVLAIANSMRTPYETVRRYTSAFLREGTCVRVANRGLIVPQSVQERLESQEALTHGYLQLQRFVGDLVRAGVALPKG